MNRPFKTIIISVITTISAFFAVTYVSCNRDKCKTIVCANGGVCNGGSCTCPSGYEGTNCETNSRDKFLGNWEVFEKGSRTNAAQYPLSVTADTMITNVVIRNLYNYFDSAPLVKGVVKNDTLFIPNQQLMGKIVVGLGYISTTTTFGQHSVITMNYEVIDTATQLIDDFGFNYPADLSGSSMWNK